MAHVEGLELKCTAACNWHLTEKIRWIDDWIEEWAHSEIIVVKKNIITIVTQGQRIVKFV